jgi:hypothetical protein
VRALRSPGHQTSSEIVRNRKSCPLDVREHERLHAVVLRSDGELVK